MKKNKIIFFTILAILITNFSFCANIDRIKKQVEMASKSVDGWCSKEKSTTIIDLILKEKIQNCVEIGVFGGSSILSIATALKYNRAGKVYAIDPWKNIECVKNVTKDDPNWNWWAKVDLNRVYKSYLRMLSKNKLQKYVKTLRMTSKEAYSKVSKVIDLLHLDGNHSEESSFYDITTYFPHVKVGGYVLFDDALWTINKDGKPFRTTKKALDYILPFCEVIQVVDNGNCILLKRLR